MSFLKNLFGPKDPVDILRQCHARQDWAAVLDQLKRLDIDGLDLETAAEVTRFGAEAGNALAAINIEEGLWAQNSGNLMRAREDFLLAIEQARDAELRQKAQQALSALEGRPSSVAQDAPPEPSAVHSNCSTCSPASAPEQGAGSDLDEETRMELLLAAMSPELAERYHAAGQAFRKAWLLAQDGDETQALHQLDAVPADERDALFLFERGSLLARSGQHQKACRDLQAALQLDPGLFEAFDVLASVHLATGQTDVLEKLLKQALAESRFVDYCWTRLAELDAQRGRFESALAAGLQAIEAGSNDPGLLVLSAQLLEREERLDEAEALLARLPAGGCGGGVHPMLGEFWLRRGSHLDKALDAFKGAMRQERDNPRWLLRIAQAYHAKGWQKEAIKQVEVLMQAANLPDPLREELHHLATQLQSR